MDYFRLNLMPTEDEDFCFFRNAPEVERATLYKLKFGKTLGDAASEDARIYMDDQSPGIKLPSLIGNARSLLIVDSGVREAIEGAETGPIEFVRLKIYNHRRRLASEDYCIVNPIGGSDCLNFEQSDLKKFSDGSCRVRKAVLDREKVSQAADLFRIEGALTEFVMSHRLVSALKERGVTNFYLRKLEQA